MPPHSERVAAWILSHGRVNVLLAAVHANQVTYSLRVQGFVYRLAERTCAGLLG